MLLQSVLCNIQIPKSSSVALGAIFQAKNSLVTFVALVEKTWGSGEKEEQI